MTQEITVRAFTPAFIEALNTNFAEIDAALDALSVVSGSEQGNFGGGPYTSGDITVTASISGNTLDVTACSQVNIGPGMEVTASGVTTCKIVQWAGGGSSGGVGTYTIDGSPQSVSSRSMVIRGEATVTVVGTLAVTDTPNAGEYYDTYDINVLRYSSNGAWIGLRGRYSSGAATAAGIVLANSDGDLEAGMALNNYLQSFGPGNRGSYIFTNYGHWQVITNYQASPRTWIHLEGPINTDLGGRNGVEGYVGLGGETNPISALTLRGNAPGLNSNWALAQFTIWGTNNNQRLSIGYDTTNDQGVIQAGKNGTGWKELLLNPAGGAVTVASAFTAGSLNTGGPASIALGVQVGSATTTFGTPMSSFRNNDGSRNNTIFQQDTTDITTSPAAITGYGRAMTNNGVQVWGVFGRADLSTTGVTGVKGYVTNEFNTFNFSGTPSGTFPVASAAADYTTVGSQQVAFGDYDSTVGNAIMWAGTVDARQYLYGYFTHARAVKNIGLWLDADATYGPSQYGALIRSKNAVPNLVLQTMGAAVPANSVFQVQDSGGTVKAYINQAGSFFGTSAELTEANSDGDTLYVNSGATITGSTSTFGWGFAHINVAESIDQSGASLGSTLNGLLVNHAGYSGYGARNGILAIYSHNATTTTPAGRDFYTGVFSNVAINSSDGGGSGTEKGAFFGFGGLVTAAAAATHLQGVIGAEFDVSMQTGSSTNEKMILQLVNVNGDGVKGSGTDAMAVLTGDGANPGFPAVIGFDYGIVFGKPNCQWPISSTGTIIGTYGSLLSGACPDGGTYNPKSAAWGVDFSTVSFSGGFLKSTGFTVNGSGATTVAGLVANGSILSGDLGPSGSALTPYGQTYGYNYASGGGSTHNAQIHFTLGSVANVAGSGTFGPASMDAALFSSIQKTSYLSSAVEGEVNAHVAVAYQGAKGDVSAFLADARKVKGSGSDTGSVLGMEAGFTWVNSGGTVTQTAHSIVAFGESAGGVSGGQGYGFHSESWGNPGGTSSGQLFAAYYVSTYDNYGIGSGNSFGTKHVLYATTARTAANRYFDILGDVVTGSQQPGDIIQGLAGNSKILRTTATGVFQIRNDADSATLFSLTNAGAAGFGVGSGTASVSIDGGASGAADGAAILFKNAGTTKAQLGNASTITGAGYTTDFAFYIVSGGFDLYTGGTKNLSVSSSGAISGTSTLTLTNAFAGYAALQSAGGTGFRWTLANNGTYTLQRTTDGFSSATSPLVIGTGSEATFSYALSAVGVGQSAATFDTAGALAGAIGVYDTGAVGGSGGAVIFGAASNSWKYAAIKGYATNGSNNSQGDIVFFTRRASTDATLTEAARFVATGGLTLSAALTYAGTTLDYSVSGTGAMALGTDPTFKNSLSLVRTAGTYGLQLATNNGTGNSTIATTGSGASLSISANGSTAITFSGSETQLGGALKMGVAYVGGAPAATGYITVKDSAGTTYKLLAST